MTRFLKSAKVMLFSSATLMAASVANAQSFTLDFKQPLFDVCNLRESCTIVGIEISAFRTANGESFIQGADKVPALLHWDGVDGLGVIGGKEDDEIDPDEMIIVELPSYRAIKMFRLSDLFLGSQGRDSNGGEYATIYTYAEDGRINRYDLQGGVELPVHEFNNWDELSDTQTVPLLAGDADSVEASLVSADDSAISQHPLNGEQRHFMESTMENRVNRIEFLALQKENNDFSVESIEFWRTSASRFSRSGGS